MARTHSPVRETPPGTLVKYGTNDVRGMVGQQDATTGKVTAVDQAKSVVKVEFDFNNVDKYGPMSKTDDKVVTSHETGHSVAIATDPVQELNRTQGESENVADKFAETVKAEKPDMTKEDARNAVKEAFGVSKVEDKRDKEK
jgi:hypothetical protein